MKFVEMCKSIARDLRNKDQDRDAWDWIAKKKNSMKIKNRDWNNSFWEWFLFAKIEERAPPELSLEDLTDPLKMQKANSIPKWWNS